MCKVAREKARVFEVYSKLSYDAWVIVNGSLTESMYITERKLYVQCIELELCIETVEQMYFYLLMLR